MSATLWGPVGRSCRLQVAFLGLAIVALSAAPSPAERIHLVGDSITVSSVSTLHTGTRSLPYRLQRAIPERLVSLYGRSGWSMAATVGVLIVPVNLDGLAAQLFPGDVVVILLGHNDYSAAAPLDTFEKAYDTALAVVEFLSARPLCVTPVSVQTEQSTNRLGLRLEDYRAAIRTVCAARGAPVIEGPELLPYEERFFTDWRHPSLAGTRRLANRLADAIRENVPELR